MPDIRLVPLVRAGEFHADSIAYNMDSGYRQPGTGARDRLRRRRKKDDAVTIAADTPTTDRSTILSARGVAKTYRTGAEAVVALDDIDLDVAAGEFLAVMGPSGSGKTTLLNCLSGLDDIDAGSVHIESESIHELSDARRTRHRAKTMGFIFQSFNLIPVFSAVENVELPLLLAGTAPKQARRQAEETLERLGLAHRLRHRPPELSGGEQQRVTVARAIAGQPTIVWADEPTGNLDTETAAGVMTLLDDLHRGGLTLILVTHDQAIGATAGRRIEVRDGRIVADERQRAAP